MATDVVPRIAKIGRQICMLYGQLAREFFEEYQDVESNAEVSHFFAPLRVADPRPRWFEPSILLVLCR